MRGWIEFYFFNSHYPTRIAAWLGVMLLFLSILLILFIFISRKFNQKRHERVERLTDKYETLLTSILFEESYASYSKGYEKVVNSITSRGFDKTNRETLIHVILKTKENLMGESDKVLTTFYHELNLRRYAMRALNKGTWEDKAFVLQELGKMDVREALPTIMRYTDHSNPILRAEAQYAAIDLAGERALGFLENLKYPLSRWQQIRITEELEKHDLQELPSFYSLLKEDNISVVVFALHLIGHFNQVDEAAKLLEMVTYPNDEVLKALTRTAMMLEYEEIVPEFLKHFNGYSVEVKVEVIKVLGRIGNPYQHLDLLFKLIEVKEYRIALASARSIFRLNGNKLSSELLQRAGARALFLKHVVDEQ